MANRSMSQEKEELASLNDRLATYIDYVRDLKNDKQRLTEELRVYKSSKTTNAEDAKALYEDEIETLRRALDDEAREKAELHVSIGGLTDQVAELRDLERKNRQLVKDNEALEADCQEAEAKAEAAEAQAKHEMKEAKNARSQLTSLRRELADLKAALEAAQADLAREQLERVNLQNENQSLRETIEFKDKLWNQTFSEKEELEITVTTQAEMEEALKLKYSQRLRDALAELREHYETLMISFKEALGNTRRIHRPNLNVSIGGGGLNEVDSAEMSAMKSTIDELTITSRRTLSDLGEERQRVKSLNRRITSLESTLSALKRTHEQEKEELLGQITSVQDQFDDLSADYEDLQLAKIRLDKEIEQYRILLQGEEQRLGLPTTPSPGRKSGKKRKKTREESITISSSSEISSSGGSKRARLNDSFTANADDICAETETSGDVHIDELNLDGFYVKLSNTTQDPIKMDGFSLITRSGDEGDAVYNFPKRFTLPAEGNVCIWSESGKQFKEQGDLLWKKQEAFYSEVGSEMALYDASGDIVSYTVLKRAADEEQEIFDSGTEQEERRASCLVM